jgi:hypothetical protein
LQIVFIQGNVTAKVGEENDEIVHIPGTLTLVEKVNLI